MNAQGQVVANESEAAPVGQCYTPPAPTPNRAAPAPAAAPAAAPAPSQGVKGAQKTLAPKVVPPTVHVIKPAPVVKPAPVAKPAPVVKPTPAPVAHVAPATKTLAQPAPTVAPARQSSTLPFTGLQLGVFAAIGVALILSGILLRTTARQRRTDTSS
jgi:hypothetical protein